MLIALVVVVYSCASVGRLEGGPVDEMPPRFLSSTPSPNALNNTRPRISILFDEYIKLDKPGEKVIISPPQVIQPDVKASGKRVVVELKDSLRPNTTYTIDFGDAIQDNNEGNPLGDFSFVFSTGAVIDSMVISGTVLNAANLEPVKGIQVGLYADLSDTAFTTKPLERAGRTDSRGRYSIRGVAPGKYRIFALQDADRNYHFNQPVEVIAFYDSLIIPSMEERMRMDTVWKDTITIDTVIARKYTHYLPDDLLLRTFKEHVSSQRLARSERPEAHKFSLYFTAPADTLPLLKGLNFDADNAFVVEKPTGRIDTLTYWIKDSLIYKIDTLKMSLEYLYTDSLKQLVPRTDTLKLASRARPKASQEKDKNKKKKKGEEAADSIPKIEFLTMDVYAPATMDIYDYLSLSFQEPIAWFDSAGIRLEHKVDSLWEAMPYRFAKDSIDIKRYNLLADWGAGQSYAFTVDSTAFHGLYGLFTAPVRKEFAIKKLDEYGQIFFNIEGAESTAFVELLDGSDKVVRTVPVTSGKADFYFLNPGKYGARLIIDTNKNGVWDTGNYANKIQPEMVYYYTQVLELKANFDLTQDWNLTAQPLDKQKPDELKKQKPDEDNKKRKQNNRNSSNRR
ncbi:MAG: Ig-like domain-containing protein [Mediterranea sp.]|jgi:uncharacterized protein (DUF2141 family)|nr:Ig-like domain-containing protein [Mediterranea sp.]